MAEVKEISVESAEKPIENGHVAPEEPTAGSSRSRRVQFSPQSIPIINEAHRLLNAKPSGTPTIDINTYKSDSDPTELTKSSTLTALNSVRPPNPYKLHTSSSLNSAGFDEVITEALASRKPAWKDFQESIKDSYYRPKRLVERQEDEKEFVESLYDRPRRSLRSTSPFAYLPRSSSHVTLETQGPYAAPAVSSSQGIESSSVSATESRYDKLINDMEARLMRNSYGLPSRYRTTAKEFRRAPEPASGSLTEAYLDEAETLVVPRPYYSRPNRRDPDYFDFDLQHSVNLYRKPEGRYIPRGPEYWESKILGDYKTKGDAPLSGHMFTKDNDYRNTGTSLLSAALRTPSFWEHRFASIGGQVRESNPVSLASLERNRPVPNKFTEYRDPDFESQEYDDLSD